MKNEKAMTDLTREQEAYFLLVELFKKCCDEAGLSKIKHQSLSNMFRCVIDSLWANSDPKDISIMNRISLMSRLNEYSSMAIEELRDEQNNNNNLDIK